MNRAYLNLNIGKSHLIKHKAATGVKCFADNQCSHLEYRQFVPEL